MYFYRGFILIYVEGTEYQNTKILFIGDNQM